MSVASKVTENIIIRLCFRSINLWTKSEIACSVRNH